MTDSLRLCRSAALRFLAPFDRVVNPASRRGDLPPLDLRRTDRSLPGFFGAHGPGPAIRFRRRSRPEAAVAYELARFRGMVETAGLRILWTCWGFFPGDDPRPRGQDILLLGR